MVVGLQMFVMRLTSRSNETKRATTSVSNGLVTSGMTIRRTCPFTWFRLFSLGPDLLELQSKGNGNHKEDLTSYLIRVTYFRVGPSFFLKIK